MKNILFILGTRPEAIKLAPLILAMRASDGFCPIVCNTEQQKELSRQTLDYFEIEADYNLDIMRPNHTLVDLNARLLNALDVIFRIHRLDAVVVQGDTMSVFAGACAAFYNRVPVCHVEAGLRSFDLTEPFPEEALRQMVSRITTLHCAPTEAAKRNLVSEGIPAKHVFVSGNTVIDALNIIPEETRMKSRQICQAAGISLASHPVLVTAHRRENHGERLEEILRAIKGLAERFSNKQFVVPVHPNPNVKRRVYETLSGLRNVVLTDPLDYPVLVEMMRSAHVIFTDSGGIQEEAPTFGVPLLVMRYETERYEGVDAGFAKLVGADSDKIIAEGEKVLSVDYDLSRIKNSTNPYGDGRAAGRILKFMEDFLCKERIMKR